MSDSNQPSLGERVRSLRLTASAESARPRSRFLPWVISFVLLLTTTAFGYRAYRVGTLPGQGRAPAAAADPAREADRGAAQAPTTAVSRGGEVVLESQGFVIPTSLVQVSPKVGGQLVWINPHFEEGRRFEAGDVLACVENVDYLADFNQARATWKSAHFKRLEVERTLPEEITQAEADLEETRQSAAQQKLDLDRNKRLKRNDALAARDLEQSQYGYDATVARVRRLESMVRLIKLGRQETRLLTALHDEQQARAALDRARARLEWTEVVAPIPGTILTKKAELGNIVNPSAFSSGISASLCEMADLSKLEVDMSIQERDIAAVRQGQLCRIMPEAYQKDAEFLKRHPQGYDGFVSRLMPTADRSKGAIPVRVRVRDIPADEVGQYLRPDMRALVSFLRDGPPESAPARPRGSR